MEKRRWLRILRKINTVFVLFIVVGLVYVTASLLFPTKIASIDALLSSSSKTHSGAQGVLGVLIAQVVPTATPTAVPTAVPTAAPTPTPAPAVISGTVFVDANNNGSKDLLEAVSPNITVKLTGATTMTTTTSALGTYSFTVPKGNYTVTITDPSGYTDSTDNPQSFTLSSNKTVNFGIIPTFSLSGNVFTDVNINQTKDTGEIGNSGLTVTASGPTPATATTDTNGDYTFPALAQGTYTITVTMPSGYKATNSNPRSVSLSANQTANFGIAQVYTVSGTIFLDNNRNTTRDTGDGNYSGGTITFTGPVTATARSAADGTFSAQLFAGTYSASTTYPSNFQATTPTTVNFSLGPNATVNFGVVQLFSISGTLFEDKNQNGNQDKGDSVYNGIPITLSGTATGSATTDSSGNFNFNNLYAGTYTVSYSVPAKHQNTTTTTKTFTFTNQTAASSTTTSPAPAASFGMVTLYDITGKVFVDSNSNGVIEGGEPFYQGGVVKLTRAGTSTTITSVSDASGNYSFLNQGGGDYIINFDTPNNYRSTTVNTLNFTVSADKTLNFGITPSTTTKVGGACNANGVDIMILFDDSGSMQENAPSVGTSKMAAAKQAASTFVDIVASHVKNAKYGLAVFASSANYPNDPTTRIMQPMTSDVTQMINAINNVPQNGNGTCVQCGIAMGNMALSQSTRNAQKVTILMTDGAANETISSLGSNVDTSTAENSAMTNVIDGVNNQNIIYEVIGIGEGSSDFDPVFMQQVADTNGGKFYSAPNNGSLQAIYQSIADTIGSGIVKGMVYNDKNTNKVFDVGDTPLPNWTVNAIASGEATPYTTKTDSTGYFTFDGLCTDTFAFSQVLAPGWYQTTDNQSYSLNVTTGNAYDNINFGNASGFSIAGNIVTDFDKSNSLTPGDVPYIQDVSVLFRGPIVKTVSTSNGVYSSGAMPPGTYNVSLVTPLTSGYRMSYPLNGPPPSFQVTIGPGCTTNGAKGAACTQ